MSLFEKRNSCPLCGTGNLATLFKREFADTDFQSFLKIEPTYGKHFYEDMNSRLLDDQHFYIVKCNSCSFIFQEYILNNNGMQKLYDKWMEPDEVRRITNSFENFGDLIANYIHRLKYAEKYFTDRPINLMDWGAGIGNFCKLAKDMPAYTVTAYDFSGEKNKELTEYQIDTKTIDKLKEKEFHFINIDQVLEHVSDPVGLLKECSKFLKDDGLIFVSTPDCSAIESLIKEGTLNEKFHECLSPHQHINAFTNKSMKVAAERAGLKTVFNPFMQIKTSVSTSQNIKMNLKNLIKPFYREFFSTSLFLSKK
jgi:2-polyprenyl-3-methyl-5-hydroxy-6-metoxy-1,4-benzoquinol methylase